MNPWRYPPTIEPEALKQLVDAARAVIAQRDACDGQDIIENIDPELDRLRKALP